MLHFPARDGRGEPVSIHPNVFHQLLETVPASGWQIRQERDGLSVLLTGLQDQSMGGAIGSSMRQVLEAQGALIGSIRVTPVDALQRGGTGKAPLILARRENT